MGLITSRTGAVGRAVAIVRSAIRVRRVIPCGHVAKWIGSAVAGSTEIGIIRATRTAACVIAGKGALRNLRRSAAGRTVGRATTLGVVQPRQNGIAGNGCR